MPLIVKPAEQPLRGAKFYVLPNILQNALQKPMASDLTSKRTQHFKKR